MHNGTCSNIPTTKINPPPLAGVENPIGFLTQKRCNVRTDPNHAFSELSIVSPYFLFAALCFTTTAAGFPPVLCAVAGAVADHGSIQLLPQPSAGGGVGTLSFKHLQQCRLAMLGLHPFTRLNTQHALGTAELVPFHSARLQTHWADQFA